MHFIAILTPFLFGLIKLHSQPMQCSLVCASGVTTQPESGDVVICQCSGDTIVAMTANSSLVVGALLSSSSFKFLFQKFFERLLSSVYQLVWFSE